MKTLTLTQPWATLVAIGAKKIETRSWRTSYTGQLAIHAAKTFPADAKILCHRNPFHAALYAGGFARQYYGGALPLGAVIATCRLVDCLPTVYQAPRGPSVFERFPDLDTPQERAFGDYSPGRFAWILEDIQPLPEPIPAKGMLGLWEWTGTLVQAGKSDARRLARLDRI